MDANAISSPAATDAMSAEASSTALLVMTAISHGCTAKSKRFSADAKLPTRTVIEIGRTPEAYGAKTMPRAQSN